MNKFLDQIDEKIPFWAKQSFRIGDHEFVAEDASKLDPIDHAGWRCQKCGYWAIHNFGMIECRGESK